MKNTSLIRFARFAFGDINPRIIFSTPGIYQYRIPVPNSFSIMMDMEEVELKRWRFKHKNYKRDFIWGYGPKANVLIVSRE